MSREKKPVILAAERIHEVLCGNTHRGSVNCDWDRSSWKRYRVGFARDRFLKKALKLKEMANQNECDLANLTEVYLEMKVI